MSERRATLLLLASTLLLLLFSGGVVLASGQQAGPPPMPNADGPQPRSWEMHSRRSIDRGLRVGPPGRWWDNPEVASKLALTADQKKKMDDIFQQSRLNLIDLMAAVQKQEVIMEPLLAADQPDESKIIAQIDRVAQARADLEKANARMLLGLRRVLTADQWQKLREMDRRPEGDRGPNGMRGPARFGPASPGPPNPGQPPQ